MNGYFYVVDIYRKRANTGRRHYSKIVFWAFRLTQKKTKKNKEYIKCIKSEKEREKNVAYISIALYYCLV